MVLSFAIIGIIAVASLKFINNARTEESRNYIFECGRIGQLAFSLECNAKIEVGEFIKLTKVNPNMVALSTSLF